MKWVVTGGGCGTAETIRTVEAEFMGVDMGCLVFYSEDGGISLAIGVGYWKDVEPAPEKVKDAEV